MTDTTQQVDKESLDVEYVDKDGRSQRARVSCTIIGMDDAQKLRKEGVESADDSEFVPTSVRGAYNIISPPYDLAGLASVTERSTELHPNIEARVTNVAGFGWQLKLIPNLTEDDLKKYEKEIKAERWRIEEFFEMCHPTQTFSDLRYRQMYDKHTTGSGYLELIHNEQGDLDAISHLRSQFIFLCEKDKEPSYIRVPYIRRSDFSLQFKVHRYRFRKYVQETKNGSPIYFKEVGDIRNMDRYTGEYETPDRPVPFANRATTLHRTIVYNPNSLYGVPHWGGAIVAIAGSREAEEINFNSISNNMVPSMFLIVENGTLTTSSATRLKEFIEQRASTVKNRSSIIVIEGESMTEGSMMDSGKFNIKVEPVMSAQQNDELYQQYDKNNADRIRCTFRHSTLFLGKGDSLNRATAIILKQTNDEQVFAPERASEDEKITRFILRNGLKSRFHVFESNRPNITDDAILADIMQAAERSGAVTPRRADKALRDAFGGQDLGPMPQIDLDRPYSMQFAEVQKYDNSGKKNPADNANEAAPRTPDMSQSNKKQFHTKKEDGYDYE